MSHKLRRLMAGVCLVSAPFVYVAGLLVDPALRAGDGAAGAYGRHPDQVSVSAALLHWSWVLLGLALAAGREVPWWAPVAMVTGMLTAPIYPIGMVAGSLLYIAGAGVIGLRMLRMSDADWAQPSTDSGRVAVTV